MKTRLLLVDDHAVVRAGLAAILSFEPDLEVVAQAECADEAVKQYLLCRPDVVLMDMRMPGPNGVSALRKIIAEDPAARILMLTTYDTDAEIHEAMEAGAKGYLLKDVAPDELMESIRAVYHGKRALSPEVEIKLRKPATTRGLSAREIHVLDLLSKGCSNKQVATTLGISEFTAKTHVSNILEKLGAIDRTAAVSTGIRLGLISAG